VLRLRQRMQRTCKDFSFGIGYDGLNARSRRLRHNLRAQQSRGQRAGGNSAAYPDTVGILPLKGRCTRHVVYHPKGVEWWKVKEFQSPGMLSLILFGDQGTVA
jgi:hypothetical protein